MLSVILPTYNEAANLPGILEEIEESLKDIPFEVIVVDDDSPDQTWEIAETLGNHVRVLRRIGRRGLSSAVVEGFSAAEGDVLAVMDCDGQHDPRLLSQLYAAVKKGATVAIGSRYVPGGSVEGWAKPRHFMSRIATTLAWLVTPVRVQDPMSGFFALSKKTCENIRAELQPRGFKILLEILANLPRTATIVEVPLIFRVRRAGESKLSRNIEVEYLKQVASLYVRRRTGSMLFVLVALLVLFALLFQLRYIVMIYMSPYVRNEVQRTLMRVADERGWLLSDIDLTHANETTFDFIHRTHLRGEDPEECYFFSYGDPDILPCSAE